MEKSDKPNLICLHGALGCATQIEAALEPLTEHANLHTFDFPGHGTRTDETITIDACVAAARDFILQNNLAGTPIFGYSMGGYVGLLLAKRYPELTGQVITLGTKLDWNTRIAESEAAKLDPDTTLEKVPKYAARLQEWHGDAWKNVLRQTAELMQDLGENPRFDDDVYQTIQHPVLFCRSEQDDLVTREETIHAAWMLPNGEFAQVPQSHHPLEKTNISTLWKIAGRYC